MKRKLTVALVLLLVCVMMLPMIASCSSCNQGGGDDGTGTTTGGGDQPDQPTYERVHFDPSKSYVFKDAVITLPVNWNPHTYETNDDAYPADFLRVGLYGFVFNDALHTSTVEGVGA